MPEYFETAMVEQSNKTYPQGYAGEGVQLQHVSAKKEAELRIARLEKDLEIQRRMLKLLEENPAIEQFMNLSRGIL